MPFCQPFHIGSFVILATINNGVHLAHIVYQEQDDFGFSASVCWVTLQLLSTNKRKSKYR